MKRKPIDRQTLKKWELLRCDCTLDDIKDGTDLGISTISNAFTSRKATQSTIDKLTLFFNNFQIPA